MKRLDMESVVRFFLAAALIMPLVFVPQHFIFPFIVPKILTFRFLTFFAFGGYLLLLSTDWRRYAPSKDPISLVVGLFLLSFAISSFAGVDWYRSVWDTHERMLGLFTLLHYGVYYLIITRLIYTQKQWDFVLRTFLAIGILVMLIGGWQRYIDPDFVLNRGASRVSATLGNAIYFSGFGFFLFIIGLLLAIKEKKKSGWWWFSVVGAALGFFGIFWGGTRGTLLGLLAAAAVSLVLLALARWKDVRVRTASVGALILLVLAVGGLATFRNTALVQSLPAVGRLARLDVSSLSENTRVMAWDIAIDSWQERPVFGWGPNNYYYAFNLHYKPTFLRYGLSETWFDNAHSAFFNTLAVQGIFGLLLYLALFIAPALMLLKAYREERIDLAMALLSVAFLVGHFVHNFVVFESPVSYLYFFFFLAYITRVTSAEQISVGKNTTPISGGMIGVVALVVLLFVYSTNINPARANGRALRMVFAANTNPAQMIEWFNAARDVSSPHIDDIRMDFARNVANGAQALLTAGDPKGAAELLDFGIEMVMSNRELHPMDVRYHLVQSQLYQAKGNLTGQNEFIEEAEAVLLEAIELSPQRQQLHYNYAVNAQRLGKPEVSEATFLAMIALDDTIGESWWRLALLYSDQGDQEKANATIQEARDKGVRFKENEERIISQYLGETRIVE